MKDNVPVKNDSTRKSGSEILSLVRRAQEDSKNTNLEITENDSFVDSMTLTQNSKAINNSSVKENIGPSATISSTAKSSWINMNSQESSVTNRNSQRSSVTNGNSQESLVTKKNSKESLLTKRTSQESSATKRNSTESSINITAVNADESTKNFHETLLGAHLLESKQEQLMEILEGNLVTELPYNLKCPSDHHPSET